MKLEAKARLEAAKPTRSAIQEALQTIWDLLEQTLSEKFRFVCREKRSGLMFGSITKLGAASLDAASAKVVTKTLEKALTSKGFSTVESGPSGSDFQKETNGLKLLVKLAPNAHYMAVNIHCMKAK